MSTEQLIDDLGEWEGSVVESVTKLEAWGRPVVQIELLSCPDSALICSGCGEECPDIHDYRRRSVRDLPILGIETTIVFWRRWENRIFWTLRRYLWTSSQSKRGIATQR